jgi:citrate lyase subunit beta/citryl-CoA lyase
MTIKLCRSVLFMPASNTRAMEKAKSLDTDVVVFDLEDATAPEKKEEARTLAAAAIRAGGYGKRNLAVRINGLDTAWWVDDMHAAVSAGADIVLVPKINRAGDVKRLDQQLSNIAPKSGTELWAMIETPRAVLNVKKIARVPGALTGLMVGTNDLVKELRGKHIPGRANLVTALSMTLLAARANGLLAIDGVYNAIGDVEGLRSECIQGRDMGFDGKSLIHPGQLEAANSAYAPSAEDIEEAQALIGAFDAAKAAGAGVATFKGKMIEELHIEEAKRLLDLTKLIKA